MAVRELAVITLAPETAEPCGSPGVGRPLDYMRRPEHPLARQGTVFLADAR